ncbi:hypothetical protein ACTQ9L_11165 [Deinococcus wulumuqiensis]
MLEVDMKCVWEGGEWKVVVVSPGPYHGRYVNCSKKVRGQGVELRGNVVGASKVDAVEDFCILVNERGKRDWSAFTRIYDPRQPRA